MHSLLLSSTCRCAVCRSSHCCAAEWYVLSVHTKVTGCYSTALVPQECLTVSNRTQLFERLTARINQLHVTQTRLKEGEVNGSLAVSHAATQP